MSLVELSFSLLIFGILTSMVFPIVTTFISAGNTVAATYGGVDRLFPVGTNMQRFVRSSVEPAGALPASKPAIPVPAFGNPAFTGGNGQYSTATGETVSAIGECSVTFFTNIGDPNGPAEITAGITTASGAPCTSTAAAPSAGWTFTVTETRASSSPDTCPIANPPGSTPPATLCTYPPANAVNLLDVTGVVNNLNSGSASYQPIFKYQYVDNSVSTKVATGNVTSVFDGACTASNCPAAAIQSVGIDLKVQLTGGAQIEDSTVVYTLSPVSSQYDSSVG